MDEVLKAALDLAEVGKRHGPQAPGKLLEDAAIELPHPTVRRAAQRVTGHMVHHEVEVVLLRWHGPEPSDRFLN